MNSITKRWLRGSLLITLLMVVAAVGIYIYAGYTSHYSGARQAMMSRISSITGQLKLTGGSSTGQAAQNRSQMLYRMVEQFDAKDKFEFMLLDSAGRPLATSSGATLAYTQAPADFVRALESSDGTGEQIYTTSEGERVMAVTSLVPYASEDAAAMRTQILNKLIDWSQTTVSKEAAAQSMIVEYYGTGRSKLLTHDAWYPVEGGTVKFGIDYTAPGIGAGENQQIRASFPTTADYLGCDAVEGTLTVNKAFVRVHVKSTSIFYDEKPTTQQYVTTKPAGDFTIFKVYSGVTSNVKGAIYLQLPESILSPEALEKIDPVVKLLCGKTLTDIFNDGMTLGELRALLQQLEKPTDDLAKFLKLFNIDISSFTELLKVVNKIPGVFDSTRVAIGSPNRAGMYLVTAITSNPNYKTGVGTGTLVVKMRATGASLTWNNDQTTYTTGELESSPLGATLMRGDTPAHNQDGVHYRYVGTTDTHRLYISKNAPTEPGTYRQTAYILGGNDMAKSISRSITITAD